MSNFTKNLYIPLMIYYIMVIMNMAKQKPKENETKAEKFKRLANFRAKIVVARLNQIKGMVASNNYDVNAEEVETLCQTFEKEIAGIRTAYDGRTKKGKEEIPDIL